MPLVPPSRRWLPSLALLLSSGCLVATPSCPSRPADPEVWFGEAWLEPDVQLRLGGYHTEQGELRPIFEWAEPGAEGARRVIFEPFGRAGHGNFVAALQLEAHVVLLAAHESHDTLGVVVLDSGGEVQRAQELQLEAPPFHFRLWTAKDAQGFVVGLSLAGQGAGLLWFDPQAHLVRALVVPGLSGVTGLALHADRSLSVLGHVRMSASEHVADGVLRVSAEGQPLWLRGVEFEGAGPTQLLDPSLAAGLRGSTILLGGKSAEYSKDLVVAELDAAGTLTRARRFPRPWPEEPLDWVVGPITQRAAVAEDGSTFVAATVPSERQASTYLTLLRLDAALEPLRQRAVATSSWQLHDVQLTDSSLRVRGKFYFQCEFDRASFSGCADTRALPALVSLPTASEAEAFEPDARPGPTESWAVELVPWTPPD